MARRRTIHILKNSVIPSQTLPNSGVQLGEPLLNLGDGILYFSGSTAGSPTWVPSNNNANYFEVGSNLYNLELRNQIKRYQNQTNLEGQFLSGTTYGFVLAPISAIAGSVDSYTTGATWTPNTLTLSLNQGRPNVPVTINSFNGLNLYGTTNVSDLTVSGNSNFNGTVNYNQTVNGGNSNEIVNIGYLTAYTESNDTYVTGGTVTVPATNSNKSVTVGLTYKNSDGTPYILRTENTFTTGGTYSNSTKSITFSRNDAAQYSIDLSNIDTNDTYVTGGTVTTVPTNNSNSGVIGLLYNQDVPSGTYTLPYTDAYTTGGTLSSNILSFSRNDGGVYSIDLNNLAPTGSTALDRYVTGFTYNNNNVITLSQNQGLANLSVNISTLGTITVNGDATVTGVTTTGNLISNNAVGTSATIGQGGLTIGSGGSTSTPGIGSLTVHGNLVVFGTGTTIATNELYVEDPQITLNYNPSGNTAITSVASGIKIQDGNGLTSGNTDVYLTIAQMNTFTGGAVTEYTGSTGYTNRAFLTQLNDIVIRNTNLNNGAPDGFRVLAEFDILDGGTY